MHFAAADNRIYFHGLNRGEKISNIRANPKVCFELDDYISLMPGDGSSPCEADAEYESVVIRRQARVMDDFEQKKQALEMIVAKYTPSLSALEMPEAQIRGTAVIEVTIESVTGKYHR